MEQDSPLQLLLLAPERFKAIPAEEYAIIEANLSHPAVKRYFALLMQNALADIAANDVETSEQEIKFVSRFKRLKGMIAVYMFLLNSFGKEKKDEAKKS